MEHICRITAHFGCCDIKGSIALTLSKSCIAAEDSLSSCALQIFHWRTSFDAIIRMNDRQHTDPLVFSAAQMKQTHRIMPTLKSAAEVPICSVTHAAVMWVLGVRSQVSHQRVRGKRWKTSCHSCLQDSSTSYNRVFMFGGDSAEFNQRADEWECGPVPCTRTLNAQREEMCSLSRGGRVAVSLYSHRKERCDLVFRKYCWGGGIKIMLRSAPLEQN